MLFLAKVSRLKSLITEWLEAMKWIWSDLIWLDIEDDKFHFLESITDSKLLRVGFKSTSALIKESTQCSLGRDWMERLRTIWSPSDEPDELPLLDSVQLEEHFRPMMAGKSICEHLKVFEYSEAKSSFRHPFRCSLEHKSLFVPLLQSLNGISIIIPLSWCSQ